MQTKPLSVAKKLAQRQGAEDYSVEQYLAIKNTPSQVKRLNQTEVIRKSLGRVRAGEAVTDVIHKSPRRVYSGVKSKVAGNIKTQNRVSAKHVRETWATIQESGLSNSYIKSAYPKTYSAVLKKPVKTASTRKSNSTNFTSGKKATPNRPMTEDYQAIIDKIKSRFNDEDLSKMSVTDLQKEIMPQILRLEEKTKAPEPVSIEIEEEEDVPSPN